MAPLYFMAEREVALAHPWSPRHLHIRMQWDSDPRTVARQRFSSANTILSANPALYPLVPQGTEILTNLGYHYTGTYLIYSVLYRTVGWQFTVATICEIDGHRTYRLQAFTLLECSIRAKLHVA